MPRTIIGFCVAALLVLSSGCSAGGGGEGLQVLSTGSPSPPPTSSPTVTASPTVSASPTFTTSPTASSSVTPTGSPSPSPSTSATALDPADELAAYLQKVKVIRRDVYRSYDRCDHAAFGVASNYADATWPQAAKLVAKEVRYIQRVRVRYDLIVPPESLRGAHAKFAKDMKARQLGWEYIAEALKYKQAWDEDSPMGKKISRQFDQARALNDAWAHAIKVEARELGVKVPWKWRTYKP